jgi:antirestriction protein
MKTTLENTPRIYVGTYAKYNNGSIKGDWLDLTEYSTIEDFYLACADIHSDEKDPEFMFQDYENIPDGFIGESWLSDEVFEAIEIVQKIEDMSDSELVSLHNEYCQNNSLSDDEIFNNDEEFFETFFPGKVTEAVRAAMYGDYNFGHEWVKFNGYANLESFDSPSNHIDKSAIIKDVLENKNNYSL